MRLQAAVAVLPLCAAIAVHGAQDRADRRPPTFRAEVRLVEIDAIVRDRDDRFVSGLAVEDFEVLEDEQPREIAAVSIVDLPERGRRPATNANEPTAESLAQSDDLGRVYVMVMDSVASDLVERVRQIAREFVDDHLEPTDLMAVLHRTTAVTQGLTNDREALRRAVDSYTGASGGRLFPLFKEIAVNLNAVRGRRKAILFLGYESRLVRDPDPQIAALDPGGLLKAYQRDYDDAVQTAIHNNVRIYPIDPRGYLVRFNARIAQSPPPGLPIGPAASGLGEGMDARIFASKTGAIAIVNTGNYRGNFEKIVRDNKGYYVIAFYSTAADGQFHRVNVRVKNRPELSVRSRDGYRASAPDVKGRSVRLPQSLSPGASELLRTTNPAGGTLPIDVFTAVFRADGFDGSVLIGCHIPGASLNLAPNERVELSYVAVDRWGVTRAADRRAFTLTLDEALRGQVARTGLRLLGRLTLPRGQYQVRVAVHQPNGRTGAAFADIEIPDFTELPLSVSDMVLSSSLSPQLTTLEDDRVLRQALPNQATPNRQFRAAETLSLFGEIYNSQWVLTPQVGVSTIIQSADRRVLFRDEQMLAATNRGRVYYRSGVPLARFTPGKYLVVLEAYTRDGIPSSASQQLEFEVVE